MRRCERLSFQRPGRCVAPRRPGRARLAAALPMFLALVLGCAHRGPAEAPAVEAPSVALQATVDRLVAIEDIQQLKARFLRCVDTKDLVCLRDEVFAPGAEIHFEGADYDIAAVGWTAIEKFYREAFTPAKFGMHHGHTPEITVDGETARGIWYLHDVFVNLEEGWTLQGSALYDDSYAKIEGEWRIMYSTYERLWEETTPRDPKTKLGSKSVRD
jgi:hypothetical protein